MGKPKMEKKSEKAKNRKMKSGKVKNQKRKNQIIKNKLLKIISKLVPNIIKAISPRLESKILNKIMRLILSKAELVYIVMKKKNYWRQYFLSLIYLSIT